MLRGFGALVGLLLFLIAVPAFLAAWRGNPLPGTWEPARWATLASRGYLHPDVIPNAIAVLAWLTWAYLTLCIAAEALTQTFRGPRDLRDAASPPGPGGPLAAPERAGWRLPAPNALRRAAARWVALASLVFSLLSSRAALAATPTATGAPERPAAPVSTPADVTAALGGAARAPAVHTSPGPAQDGRGLSQPGRLFGDIYRCGPYDTLRSVAAQFLHDPDRWKEIRDASIGLRQPDGTTLHAGFVVIGDGTLLRIPLAPPTAKAATPTAFGGAPQPDQATAPVETSHLVRPRETLWRIARDAYPDAKEADLPRLVARIFDANLGAPDPAGRRLHDPNVLNPGMTLRLPGLAASRGAPTPETAPRDAELPPATPAEPPGSPAPEDQPPTSSPNGSGPPAVVRPTSWAPGPTRLTPSAPAPSASSDKPASAGAPIGPSPAPRAPRDAAGSTPLPTPIRRGHSTKPELLPVWVGAAGLLTAAVALTVAARRRRRDHTVGRRSAPPPPDPRAAALHTAVLATADLDGLSRLDAALRDLAAQCATPAIDANATDVADGPEPLVVLVRPDDTIDVYLRDSRLDPPMPWEEEADGRIWILPPTAALPPPPDIPPPCPLLVQLGTEPDGAELYADLEALGVLTLDPGDTGAEGLRALARALLATLALSPFAARSRLEVVGFDPLGLLDDDRIAIADDLPALLARITPDLQALDDDLAVTGHVSTFAARAADPAQNWEPTAAFALHPHPAAPDLDARADLVELAGGGGLGLAVVIDHHADPDPDEDETTAWRLLFDGHADADGEPLWRLDPLGLRLRPAQLAADELRDLLHLLADADRPPQPVPVPPAATDPEPYTGPDWQVMIGLLGPLTIVARDGRRPPAELARERTLEVLAWLATHRGRTRSDLEAAIWPTGAQARSINNQLGRARSILVTLAGEHARQWLPTRRTTITLHPAVVTDLDLLHAHIDHAEAHRHHPEIAVAALTDGLDLVRGTPARHPWLDAELGSQLTTTVVRAALLLADLHLARGDTNAVLDATRRGLAVLPAHPSLFAQRMRAYAETGDRSAVRAEYHAYRRAEQADPLWDGDTDPDLENLHRDLLRQPVQHVSRRSAG